MYQAQSPEQFIAAAEALTAVTGILVGTFAGASAVIDGIRPTSRLVRNYVEDFVQAKNGLAAIGQGVVKAARYLSHINYGEVVPRLAYDVLHPSIPERALRRKGEFLAGNTLIGAIGGAGFYAIPKFMEWAENGFDNLSRLAGHPISSRGMDFLYDFTNNHAGEMIMAGAAIGFGASAYGLLFRSPINREG